MRNGLGLSTTVLIDPTTTPMYEQDGEWLPVPVPTPLRETIRKALLNALAYTDGNQQWAARLLGMTARSFNYHLARFGIPTETTGLRIRKRGRKPVMK